MATGGAREGRYRAPPLVEHDRAGRPLARPYPRQRGPVRALVALAGVLAVGAAAGRGAAVTALVAAAAVLAAAVLPRLLVATPHPTFLTLRTAEAATLAPGTWIRLRGGWAVQVMNVHLAVPGVVGDATPPAARVRCSDGVTRTLRPHDPVAVLQPVDLRRPRRDPERVAPH